MTLDDILDLVGHTTHIAKSRDQPIKVRIAWYSLEDNDDTYHICLECGHYGGILLSNLEISTEDKLRTQGFTLCRYCRGRISSRRECQGVFLTVRES